MTGLDSQGLHWASNRLRTAAGAYRALRELLEHDQYDIVEYPECGGDGAMVSTLLPVTTCVRFHSPAALIMADYGPPAADVEATTFFEQVAIDRADLATAPSAFMAAQAETELRADPPVHVIANGIDLDVFDAHQATDVSDRVDLPDDAGAVTILFSGRLERRKGAHLLGDIFASVLRRYPHVHVAVAGADPDRLIDTRIRPLLADQGLEDRLHPLGRLSLPEVAAVWGRVDIGLHPTQWDNAPYSCIEAMASRTAVVASDTGGMPELIEHGRTGLLARRGDASSFVDALAQLIEDPQRRAEVAGAARQAVEDRYTDAAMASATVEVWRQHLERARRPVEPAEDPT